MQRVLVSTTPDWQDVSKWYWDLSQPHLEATTPEMTNTVNELTAGAKTDMDKIKSIFYYVSKNIRYMGLTPEKDRPGFRAARCQNHIRQKIRRLPGQGRVAGLDAAHGGLEFLSRADQRRHQDGPGSAGPVFQSRHRQRGNEARANTP